MPDKPEKPEQDPVEGSREVIDKELAKQGKKGQGGHTEIAGTASKISPAVNPRRTRTTSAEPPRQPLRVRLALLTR